MYGINCQRTNHTCHFKVHMMKGKVLNFCEEHLIAHNGVCHPLISQDASWQSTTELLRVEFVKFFLKVCLNQPDPCLKSHRFG